VITQSAAEESGSLALTAGQATAAITFIFTKMSQDYAFEDLYIENTTDANPGFIGCVPSAKSTAGFTVSFAAVPDSANYVLRWHVMV
jgi:hypothetical protein